MINRRGGSKVHQPPVHSSFASNVAILVVRSFDIGGFDLLLCEALGDEG